MYKLIILLALLTPSIALAQSRPNDIPTTNRSVTITTGLTYQTLLAGVTNNSTGGGPVLNSRLSLTIENNNISDSCYLIIGTNQITPGTTTTTSNITINGNTVTAAQASILLLAGGSYQRYFPQIPSDTIYVTCATTGDSVYIDFQ